MSAKPKSKKPVKKPTSPPTISATEALVLSASLSLLIRQGEEHLENPRLLPEHRENVQKDVRRLERLRKKLNRIASI